MIAVWPTTGTSNRLVVSPQGPETKSTNLGLSQTVGEELNTSHKALYIMNSWYYVFGYHTFTCIIIYLPAGAVAAVVAE